MQADSKLRRLCGFDLRFALPSEATFSRALEELASSELVQRVHAQMIKDTLVEQLIGHISRDATAVEARETIAKKDNSEIACPIKVVRKRGRPAKGEVRPPPESSALQRQSTQTLEQMMAEHDTPCATGTKKNRNVSMALIDHNPRGGDKRDFAPHEAQRYKTRSSAERCNARLKDEFGARHVQVRGHAKVMCH